jgi:hypothetical protein
VSALEDIPLPLGIDREELRADLEGMRSLLRTGRELRSDNRRREIANIIASARGIVHWIQEPRPGKIQYFRFVRNLNAFIDELEKDRSPTLLRLLDINSGVSEFENAVRMIADRWRHHFDTEPGYSTSPLDGKVGGPFIRFAEAILVELEVYKEDGSRYAPAAIKEALKKLRRVRV